MNEQLVKSMLNEVIANFAGKGIFTGPQSRDTCKFPGWDNTSHKGWVHRKVIRHGVELGLIKCYRSGRNGRLPSLWEVV